MPIHLTCSTCGAAYDVPETRAGQTGRCKCGALLRVPAAEEEEAPSAEDAPPLPVPEEAPAPVYVPPPSRKRRAGRLVWLWAAAAGVVVIGLLGGAVLVLRAKGVALPIPGLKPPPKRAAATAAPSADGTQWAAGKGTSEPLAGGSARGEITSVDLDPQDSLRYRVHYTWSGAQGKYCLIYGMAPGQGKVLNLQQAAKMLHELTVGIGLEPSKLSIAGESGIVAAAEVGFAAEGKAGNYSTVVKITKPFNTSISGTGAVGVQAFDFSTNPPTPLTNAYYVVAEFD